MNARANNLGILYPIIPSECIKTRARVIFRLGIRHVQFGFQNYPARRLARYFRLSEQAQNILVFQLRWKSRSFVCVNAPITSRSNNIFTSGAPTNIFASGYVGVFAVVCKSCAARYRNDGLLMMTSSGCLGHLMSGNAALRFTASFYLDVSISAGESKLQLMHGHYAKYLNLSNILLPGLFWSSKYFVALLLFQFQTYKILAGSKIFSRIYLVTKYYYFKNTPTHAHTRMHRHTHTHTHTHIQM